MRKASWILLCVALLGFNASTFAQERFSTPKEAVEALVAATKTGDQGAILKVLGPEGKPIVSSGDPVADSNIREDFISAYDAKHAIEMEGDGTQTLIIGNDDWPFPIPLVNEVGEWQFNTKAGLDEILRRRVGRNELSAIQVSLAYVQAQNEYASLDPARHGRGAYAQRIVSSPGKKDGLYWPSAEGEEPSPLGDLAAQAAVEGYKIKGARNRSWRRLRLCRQRQDDRWLWPARLSCRLRQFRHYDLHGQSGRHRVSEGSRRSH